jgi:hypothetical protein
MTYIETKTYKKEVTIEIDPIKDLAVFMHSTYELIAKQKGWDTQKKTQVVFNKLPKENKETMLELAKRILDYIERQGVDGYDDFHNCICIKKERLGK